MKLTHEKLAALKALKLPDWLARKDDPWAHEAARAIPALIADLEEAQRRISISEAFAKELSSELITTRKQLAEAQALLKRLSPLMINAGYVGANADIQRSLRDVRVDLVRLDTPALDAAIAEAIEPYRKDTKRLDYIAREYIKIDPFDIPTGADDADVGWRLSQYRMGKPSEVVIVAHYGDDLRAAIDAARKEESNEQTT